MKKTLKIITITCLIGTALFCNKKANAQTTITTGTPVSMVEAFNVAYSATVKSGDTVTIWWEWSADQAFSAPEKLPIKKVTTDTTVKDTFSVSGNKLPPVDSITGYSLYLRLAKIINNSAVSYSTPVQSVVVYPKPIKIKVTDFTVTSLSGGGVVSFFGSTGSNYENANVKFRFRYGNSDIWRKPNPDSTGFMGMNQSFSKSLSGMLSNKSIDLWVMVNNSVSNWDTVVTFTTTPTSTKPVVVEAAGKTATADSIFLKVDVTSFNLDSKFYCINTVNNDTNIKNVTSPKMENIPFNFGKLWPDTKYTFKVYGINSMGIGNVINITITTPPKIVTPTFTALTPDVRFDASMNTFYIYPKVNWVTNSDEKIKRIDIRIYKDSLYQSVPEVWQVSSSQSALTGPLTGPRIDSDSGRFYYEFVTETATGIFTSNLLGYNVKKSLVPITGNVNSQFLPTTPVECKLFDLSGKIISISYIVNPNINLFDSNLPYGILIAVPVENYRSFRTYNHMR